MGTATVADGIYAGIGHWSPESVSVLQDLFSDQEWAVYLSLGMSAWLLGSSTWALCLELPRICYAQHNKKRAIEGSDKDLEQGGATSPIVSTCCGVSERAETPTVRLVDKNFLNAHDCLSSLDDLCTKLTDQIDKVHPKTSEKMPCLPGNKYPNYGTIDSKDQDAVKQQIKEIKVFVQRYQDTMLDKNMDTIETVANALLSYRSMHQKKLSMSDNAYKQAQLKKSLMNGMKWTKDRIEECEKALHESSDSSSVVSLTSVYSM